MHVFHRIARFFAPALALGGFVCAFALVFRPTSIVIVDHDRDDRDDYTITAGTLNTVPKFVGIGNLANSAITDDATTLAYAVNKFTVLAANGNTAIAGTLGVTALTTLTAGFTLGADSSANSHKITNLTDPSGAQDAMTLAYANSHYGAGSVTSSTLTSNTIPKATGASAIGNSALTDDATTLAYATTKFTVVAASGNTAIAGTANITGLATLTAGFTLGADATANSHKITSLTNGSSAQDAAAFGQISSAVTAAVVGTTNTVAKFSGTNAVGNASFTDNGTTVTFSTNVALGTHTLTGVTDLTTTGNTTLGDAAADTLTVNATSSFVNPVLTAAVRSTAITPAAITGATNNWAPTGIGTAEVIYVATSGAATISGLVSTECTNGRTIMLVNISANNVLLLHSSGLSTRPFHNTGGFTWTLYPANDWGHTNELSTITYRCSTTSNSWEQTNFSNMAVPGWEIDGQTILNGTTTVIGGPGNGVTFTNSNHLLTNGGAGGFALACNGTGGVTCATNSCTDLAGSITTNTAATTCTVTFGGTYTTSPTCTVSTGTVVATPAYISARSATAITITFPALTAGVVDYICIGH